MCGANCPWRWWTKTYEDPQAQVPLYEGQSSALTANSVGPIGRWRRNAPGEPHSDRRPKGTGLSKWTAVSSQRHSQEACHMVNIRGSDLTRQPLPSIHKGAGTVSAGGQVLRQRTAGGGSPVCNPSKHSAGGHGRLPAPRGRFRQREAGTTYAGSSESAGRR